MVRRQGRACDLSRLRHMPCDRTRLCRGGTAVVLADKDEEPVNAAAGKLTAAGRDAIAVRCDVTDDAVVASMVERTASRFGRLDAAFNNAGIMQRRVDTAEIEGDDEATTLLLLGQ